MPSPIHTSSSRQLFGGVFCCFHPHSDSSGGAAPKNKPSQCSKVPDNAIPVIIYGDSSSKPRYFSKYGDPGCCSICLGEFTSGEALKMLPKCSHIFHKECIDQWLPSRSLHCPVCRDRAVEKLSQAEGNRNITRSQSDTDGASTLLVLNFVSAATRHTTFI